MLPAILTTMAAHATLLLLAMSSLLPVACTSLGAAAAASRATQCDGKHAAPLHLRGGGDAMRPQAVLKKVESKTVVTRSWAQQR